MARGLPTRKDRLKDPAPQPERVGGLPPGTELPAVVLNSSGAARQSIELGVIFLVPRKILSRLVLNYLSRFALRVSDGQGCALYPAASQHRSSLRSHCNPIPRARVSLPAWPKGLVIPLGSLGHLLLQAVEQTASAVDLYSRLELTSQRGPMVK
jgi:hypothetical protein